MAVKAFKAWVIIGIEIYAVIVEHDLVTPGIIYKADSVLTGDGELIDNPVFFDYNDVEKYFGCQSTAQPKKG